MSMSKSPFRFGLFAAGEQTLRKRGLFNFVGMGKATILALVLLIVASMFYSRAHGLGLDLAPGLWLSASIALASIALYSGLRCSWAVSLATLVPIALEVLLIAGLATVLSLDGNGLFSAAVLTIIGYSFNSKRRLFERTVANLNSAAVGQPLSLSALVNQSIHQTLGYLLQTLLVLMTAVVGVFLFEGAPLPMFALALVLGLLLATASSLFISSALWLTVQQRHTRTLVPTTYRAALDNKAFLATLLMLSALAVSAWFYGAGAA